MSRQKEVTIRKTEIQTDREREREVSISSVWKVGKPVISKKHPVMWAWMVTANLNVQALSYAGLEIRL
jgi:hypothetical protein